MARTKQFDRDAALKAAIGVFWRHGYAATSTDALMQAMGIGRQSLYDTFGDKRRLYLEALQRYNAESLAEAFALLRSEGSPLAAIERLLIAYATRRPEERERGCMGVNAICEFGASDDGVSLISQGSGLALQGALEAVMHEAKAGGELPAALDEKTAAQFIGMTLVGLKVQAKAGASAESLRRVATLAVQGLSAGGSR